MFRKEIKCAKIHFFFEIGATTSAKSANRPTLPTDNAKRGKHL